jgi:hypothetical protein
MWQPKHAYVATWVHAWHIECMRGMSKLSFFFIAFSSNYSFCIIVVVVVMVVLSERQQRQVKDNSCEGKDIEKRIRYDLH